jgi:hypothetical protein
MRIEVVRRFQAAKRPTGEAEADFPYNFRSLEPFGSWLVLLTRSGVPSGSQAFEKSEQNPLVTRSRLRGQ